jgi:beta-galactosidase
MMQIYRFAAATILCVLTTLFPAWAVEGDTQTPIVIDASVASQPPKPIPFSVGGKSPSGHVISANQRYLTLDGKPWFPVMGEFHYSRYSESEWDPELLKMKAAGIDVISTYVFWIHHEEIEGQFDWSGQRDLRHFVELCAKHGLYVWIRVGPWDHGEARNGGIPDWVLEKSKPRQNDPAFLGYVQSFYDEIGKQLTGLFWKDDGPIIGIQLDNEYSARGPGKGAEYILRLRKMARSAGIDAPFYTITGWDNAVIPSRGVLPVFSGYADGFWWRSLSDRPPSPNYFFTKIRCEENVNNNLHSTRPDIDAVDAKYPYLTAEMGGGMEVAYHRRPLLSADDTAAMEVVKLGSGVVLYGYYMFHGGTNPDGKKTTLQESQATDYPNDVPEKSYDFQAPLGEFGQMNPSYGVLKTLHLFLDDFGTTLAPMTSYFPKQLPTSKKDTRTPRVAARFKDNAGFLFLNNYEHIYEMQEKKNFQVSLKLPSGRMTIPEHPVNIPSGAYTIWPVNLPLGETSLRYATAQMLCELDDPNTYVFFAWPGIAPEFAFDEKEGVSIESPDARIRHNRGVTYVDQIEPGTQSAIRVRDTNGITTDIIVLTRKQALNAWKAMLAGKERLILSSAQLYFDHDEVHALTDGDAPLNISFSPALDHEPDGFTSSGNDGEFKTYSVRIPQVSVETEIHKLQDPGADPPPKMGKLMMGQRIVLVPEDSAFDTAAEWTIVVPHVSGSSHVFLKIKYEGDIARIYSHGKLLTDNFYNGTPWIVGIDQDPSGDAEHLEIKVLPLHKNWPIYLPKSAAVSFPPSGQVAEIQQVQVVIEHEAVMQLKP